MRGRRARARPPPAPHLAHDVGQVRRARVAHGDGRVRLNEQQRGGDADDVGAAEHDGALAVERDARAREQREAALWRARDARRRVALERERAHVERVQPVGVLLDGNGAQHRALVDVRGERQLHEHAIDARVRVERRDGGEHVGLRRVRGQIHAKVRNARRRARRLLVAHVRRRVRSRADEHDGEPGRAPEARRERGDARAQLLADRVGRGLAVDEGGGWHWGGGEGAGARGLRRTRSAREGGGREEKEANV